jgi:hypothetical protein
MPVDVTANFIRIRVASPSQFVRFAVKTLGKGIKAVIGFKKGGGSQIQSFLFPKSRYTLAQAKAWIKAHDYHISESLEDITLVRDILVGPDFLDFDEISLTREIEAQLNLEKIEAKDIKPKTWEWLIRD